MDNSADAPVISIVSPVHKGEKLVNELTMRIINSVSKISENFEIILVEDGSPDNSWQAIREKCSSDRRIKGIKLSRNFGQHHAITAGLNYAKGEWVVVMDCDLQDRPEHIPALYNKALEGYDVVVARRGNRRDSGFKKALSLIFHQFLSFLTGTHFDRAIANFGIYNGRVINVILEMKESIRYFPTMVKWVGFRSIAIDVDHGERFEGKSSYNIRNLLRLSVDIMLAYSDKPLRLMIQLGAVISLCAFLLGIYVIVLWYFNKLKVLGYASLIISIWFLGGMIISMLGLLGLYTGKIFEGVKNRPIYIVSETVN